MSVRNQFLGFWKSHYNVLSVSLYSIILIVLEEIMETEFKCPQKASLKHWCVFSYFFFPAFIVFFLTLTSNPSYMTCICCAGKCSRCRTIKIMFRILLPPLIWCVILLCDGRYIDCVTSRSQGNRDQNANQSSATELPSETSTIWQIAGMGILALVSLLYGLYRIFHFCSCCKDEEEHWKDELESLLEEEVRKHIEKKKKEHAKQIMQEKVKPSLQQDNANFWENVDFRNTMKKIKETVECGVRETRGRQEADQQSVPLTSRTEQTSETST
ncbi:uncharacterized protein [Numenius arquata]|uniref:uncharacterized protein n=1 Tax=Numenius arquata TaxID=31919 RepID=UPI003D307377